MGEFSISFYSKGSYAWRMRNRQNRIAIGFMSATDLTSPKSREMEIPALRTANIQLSAAEEALSQSNEELKTFAIAKINGST
jgi:hypothetical protein